MHISLFELFSIGVGPSSSHTVGPMRAACQFVKDLDVQGKLGDLTRLKADLYGSLALTGVGHGTDKAVLNGLEGKEPETVDPDILLPRMQAIENDKRINANGKHVIAFDCEHDLLLHKQTFLPKHANGMRFTALANDTILQETTYYSVGGGFIVTDEEFGQDDTRSQTPIPYPFTTAAELFAHCSQENYSIRDIMFENEKAWRSDEEIKAGILRITDVMEAVIQRGCATEGELPGGLRVKRRAASLYTRLQSQTNAHSIHEEADILNYLNVYALAVNEENAAGGRIVTAPTNGAAGIIPAVLNYYKLHHEGPCEDSVLTYMLTAAAIGILYKKGASISGAEVGCQGEVGVASSMAAGGLCAALGGSISQIENAAEIAMEHHLGMTCDPVAGLVQIPCIERNAMGAVKAVNAARLALVGSSEYHVTLDKVIKTMWETGQHMKTILKETSQGGLAANVIEC